MLLVLVLFMRDETAFAAGFISALQLPASEIAKFAIIVLFAHFAAQNADKMKTFKYGVMPFAAVLGVVAVLVVAENHLSGTILIMLLGISMMFLGGTDLKWFGILIGAGVGAVLVILAIPGLVEYAETRLAIWQNPWADPQGDGFQTIQSLIAIGSGGIWGTGIGNSRQKYLYIPEPQNDFIFSIICEELGFVGAVLILLLFALLVGAVRHSHAAKDSLARCWLPACTMQWACRRR